MFVFCARCRTLVSAATQVTVLRPVLNSRRVLFTWRTYRRGFRRRGNTLKDQVTWDQGQCGVVTLLRQSRSTRSCIV